MNPILEMLRAMGLEPTRENIRRVARLIPGYEHVLEGTRALGDLAVQGSEALADFAGRAGGELAQDPVRGYGNYVRGIGSGVAGLGRFLPGEGALERTLMGASGQLAPEEGSAQGALGRLVGEMAPDLVGADLPLVPGRMAEAEGAAGKGLELLAVLPFLPGGMGKRGSDFLRKLNRGVSEATAFDLADDANNTVPPPDLMAPTMGAPYIRPTGVQASDRTYGIFDPEAPRLEATRPSDPLYAAGATEAGGETRPLYEALVRSQRVQRLFDGDVTRGLLQLDGRPWYETGGLRAAAESEDDFRRWNVLGSAASMQNSVPSELMLGSLMNWANRRGITDWEEAANAYRRIVGREELPFLISGDHFSKGQFGLENDLLLPTSANSPHPLGIHYNAPTWKTPSFYQARMGASDAMATIDTHERRRLWQIIQSDPRLRRLARESLTEKQYAKAMEEGLIPIRNQADYAALSQIYEQGAQRFGLPTASAYQAPRWTGGGVLTGLESNPTRTYQELLADQVLTTARAQGMDESPAGLRRLLGSVLRGEQVLWPGPSTSTLPDF